MRGERRRGEEGEGGGGVGKGGGEGGGGRGGASWAYDVRRAAGSNCVGALRLSCPEHPPSNGRLEGYDSDKYTYMDALSVLY